jgi:hypothetical protein
VGPLNALFDLPPGLDFSASGVRPGDPVRRNEGVLEIGRLAFAAAGPAWRPPRLGTAWQREPIPEALAALAEETRRLAREDGFAPLIAPLCIRRSEACLARGAIEAALSWPGQARALQIGSLGATTFIPRAIEDIARWIAACAGDPPGSAEILIGLGPGLTPSGDDLVGGILVALHALGEADRAMRLGAWALALAETGTNRISLAHLRCAAAGEGAEALHLALAALGSPGTPGLGEAVRRLAAIGHSSGLDALAGVALACAALTP